MSYELDLSALTDVGTLNSTPISQNSNLLSEFDPTDVFAFDLASDGNIHLYLHNISLEDDADIRLFEDTNSNGIWDADDLEVDGSFLAGNASEVIDYTATAGTYFAQVERYGVGSIGEVSYELDLSVTIDSGAPKPTTYQPFDASQVFSLNSNPGADHTIYLDFDGHTTTGTLWNADYGTSIVTPAYDTDGDVSFSTAELESIWQMWQRVAEDFIPFDVNVTTALPSTEQLINSGGSDTQWGVRVAIGGSDSDWYNELAGGVAYLDSFNWDVDTPTFVFSDDFGGSEKNIAEAISHEVGHTLGLEHDGDSLNEYYQGHGFGATGWASIMGVGYNSELTQWSRGEYTDASNLEDDLDIITGQNGFGYRADDYGDVLTDPAALSFNGTVAETYGIIETNTDTDWFAFSSTTGDIALNVDPFVRGPNLDILAQLYDATGQLILSSNPIDALGASFDVELDPGQYYLSVTGTGQGDVATTGYSDYGSLGQYSITGTVV